MIKLGVADIRARKAASTLLELLHTSFKFLDYSLMPKTTNEIEAQFGHLVKRWLAHRGLKKQHEILIKPKKIGIKL